VSLTKRLRLLLVCGVLEMGVLLGVPMRPEEIQGVMHQMNQPKMGHTLPSENDEGDDPPSTVNLESRVPISPDVARRTKRSWAHWVKAMAHRDATQT
jgi:hypothetical protein